MNKHTSRTLRTAMAVVLAVCASGSLRAQTGVEYFFDSDPGLGKATRMTVTTNTDAALSIPISGLTAGYHLVGLRAYSVDANQVTRYAPTITQQIFVPTNNGLTPISRVEYFWDTDPGVGKGTPLAVTPGKEVTLENIEIPTTGLKQGSHLLGIRAYGERGWSPTLTQEVFVPSTTNGANITRVEYYWDADPGFGKATPLPITPGKEVTLQNVELSTAGLAAGEHRLFVRAYGNQGWTPTISETMFVEPDVTDYKVRYAEYFWGKDPGFGKGTAIQLTPGETVSIENLVVPTEAQHGDAILHVRYRGEQGWSPTIAYTMLVDAAGNYTLNAQSETSADDHLFKTLGEAFDDFADRGISDNITMTVATTSATTYELDATSDERIAQIGQLAQNLERISGNDSPKTIAFTTKATAGRNTIAVTTTDEGLPTVVSLFAQTSLDKVTLKINGVAYNFTLASQRFQRNCGATTAVSLSSINTGIKATWQAQPHEGTTLSGYVTEGEGDLPEMTLENSGTKTDSLAYHVTLSTSEGQPLYSYTYYYYVRAKMANQAFTTMQPATGSTVDPVKTTLEWNAFNEATGYRITVTEAAEGGDPKTIVNNQKTTEPKYEVTVKTGYSYTWTVTAVGNCDELTSEPQTLKGRLLPDFVVESITLPEAAPSGTEITVTAVIKNQGVAASVEGQWTDRLYYTINSTKFTDAVPAVDVVHEGNVAVGDSYEVTFTMTVPYAESGTLRVFVEANADQTAMETNASANNNRMMSTTTATMTPLYIQDGDLAALRTLYNDFGGSQWNGTKWNTASEIVASGNWSGVTFDSNGRVTAINLHARGLTGSLSTATPLSLPLLTTLNMCRNALTGDPSLFITNSVPKLKTLDLSYNQIDVLSKPLSNDIAVTLTYQHRTYGNNTQVQGMENLTSQTLNIGTKMEVTMPAVVGYVHIDQSFDAIPDIYINNKAMKRYGTLSWSNTNDCYGFTSNGSFMKDCVDDEEVYLIPATGAFANSAYPAKMHLVTGDANMTGWVDVNDVQSTLNYIISNTTTKFCLWAANTWNSDDIINIQDIVCTVNIVLDNQGGGSSNAPRRAGQETVDNIFFADGRYIYLDARDEIAAFDLELEGVTPTQVRLLLNKNDWQMVTRDTEQGVRLVVFSPTGQTLATGQTQLLKLSGDGQPVAAQATSHEAEPVAVGVGSEATGISELQTADGDEPVYDLQGRKLTNGQLQKGVYIQNGKKIKK